MIEYSYDPPYNLWSGNRSDTLNKWKINYKGSIATASALPEKGDFKGDTYNVLEDGCNYMWNGKSWDKLDANAYVGATSTANGIQGLVPPATSAERGKFLKGDASWDDIAWSMITNKPLVYPPDTHDHDDMVHKTGDESIAGVKSFSDTIISTQGGSYSVVRNPNLTRGTIPSSNTGCWQWITDQNGDCYTAIESMLWANGTDFVRLYVFQNAESDPASFCVEVGIDSTGTEKFFRPSEDSAVIFGASNRKWGQIYSSNSTISTSDERVKTNIATIPNEVLDAWGDISWSQYQLIDSVNKKGEINARLHTGLIAQRIDSVFKNHNINISQYGLFCYDEWEAIPEEYDDKGNITHKATKAGDVYSLRYEEALCMEAAYQRRRADRAEARIKALEDRLSALEARMA